MLLKFQANLGKICGLNCAVPTDHPIIDHRTLKKLQTKAHEIRITLRWKPCRVWGVFDSTGDRRSWCCRTSELLGRGKPTDAVLQTKLFISVSPSVPIEVPIGTEVYCERHGRWWGMMVQASHTGRFNTNCKRNFVLR